MNMLLMMLLGTALCYAGMAGLSLAMPRNYSQLNAAKLSARNNFVLRVASIALLIVSLWPVISMWGVVVGIVIWLGLLSVAAVMWVSLLAYWPRLATAKALGLSVVGLASCVVLWLC
ncbi:MULTISPECIES: DUF3325 domain-containing protein [unclassified Methylophaga]|jgi:hypothetical protein|uniref:DUF3325 domain-containing protein n=1 Tax=unclassified Methylophaga TaxID=2629249 RepID=UPI000C8F533A|nr:MULTISPECIES: DUF3325 domain-containing protein [unclassified Methylophaga]MAK66709.1 hypothetical protein [Methylophaga sp.]MAY17723.1 hypothetical protein [Methylophaga sp.]MBN46974.1 hypothetical protein [Methylophaga sp.]HCD05857.1 DUF3325 domain-containing protein [Methylophaga sp.]|tara:strand:- start:8194 stop:8544 length:351 start_codon:yes stop_codon:yes gene_type:complete